MPRSASADMRPTRDVRSRLSTVISCETFTTESRASPTALRPRRTFPGAAARRRLEVTTAQIVVPIALSLKSLDCTTRTGRRKPAPIQPDRRARPTRSRRDALPALLGQRSRLHLPKDGIEPCAARLGTVYRIEPFAYPEELFLLDEFRDGSRVQLTAGDSTPLREAFGLLEYLVRERDRCFHDNSITTVILAAQAIMRAGPPYPRTNDRSAAGSGVADRLLSSSFPPARIDPRSARCRPPRGTSPTAPR